MKQHLEYKGYIGSVEVDLDEGFVYGRLLFIRDVVSFRAEDVRSVRAAFEAAVDDYLTTCAALGDAPDVPCKGTFNVRIGPELHQEVALAAAHDGVTLNDWVKRACILTLAQPKPRIETPPQIIDVRRLEASFDEEPYAAHGGNVDWQQQQNGSTKPSVH